MTRSEYRGNEIFEDKGVWRYITTGSRVAVKELPCARCKCERTLEGHDACLGILEGVVNACCGHGNNAEAYIQYPDGSTIHGENALIIMRKGQNNDHRRIYCGRLLCVACIS
jgi:hypothetical protein